MKQIRLMLIACITLFTLAACSKKDKDDTGPSNNPSVTLSDLENKMVGAWKIESSKQYDNNNNPAVDLMTDCQKDDVFTFMGTKKYDANLGTDNCGSFYGTAQKTGIEWSASSDSLLSFTHWPNYSGGVAGAKPKIIEITSTKLVLQQKFQSIVTQTVINTYTKQ
jgi:hypothetical protein